MDLLRRLSVALLFATLAAVYLAWSWSSVLGGFGGDNANYLFMARHFSPFSETSAVTENFVANSIYPPLFPLLLGLTGGGESLLVAHVITTLCLIGAYSTLYWWLRQKDIGTTTAAVVLLAVALLPGMYLQTLSVHSENLYMLCSLATLACASAVEHGQHRHRWIILALVALAAAYMTRGAGLALIVAWLAWVWLNRMPWRIGNSLFAILPVLVWSNFGSAGSTNYWGHLTHAYYDPAAFLSQIVLQSHYLLGGWVANFGSSSTAEIAALLILLLGLSSAFWRTWLRHIDGFYVWCYLGMIVLWPFPAEAQRLILVLVPVLLWQTVWALHHLSTKVRVMKLAHSAVLVVVLLAVLPEFALNAQRFFTPLPSDVPDSYRHTEGWYVTDIASATSSMRFMAALETDLHRLGKYVPESDCVFAIKPSIVAYLSGRLSKAPPSVSSDQASFEDGIQSAGCRYFYMLNFASPSYPLAMYPYQRLHTRLEVIKPISFQPTIEEIAVIGILARLK